MNQLKNLIIFKITKFSSFNIKLYSSILSINILCSFHTILNILVYLSQIRLNYSFKNIHRVFTSFHAHICFFNCKGIFYFYKTIFNKFTFIQFKCLFVLLVSAFFYFHYIFSLVYVLFTMLHAFIKIFLNLKFIQ